ncbi:uncharacterized protein LOC114420479 [Glycine soja]|uniref:uncharacterized protein LOC114420479 n=1 Tax=Glycine soja TaxID=3848 RepID=UPI001039E92A|nr:uncharacterized protein LOC114420479 [Glycine soja]
MEDDFSFRRLIGRLIYLTNIRPDITYVVQHLSQFVAAPTSVHQQPAVRILRYIKRSPIVGIFLFATSKIQLKGISDCDWVGCIDTRRSITSYAMYIGDSLISWRSKKQATVSKSSSEAEYRALASAICELQ